MRDRRDIIRAGVKAKVTNMSEIRSMYNEFDEGGNLYSGEQSGSNYLSPMQPKPVQRDFSIVPINAKEQITQNAEMTIKNKSTDLSKLTPREAWESTTLTPWSEAKRRGLTDGSGAGNLKLRADLSLGKYKNNDEELYNESIETDIYAFKNQFIPNDSHEDNTPDENNIYKIAGGDNLSKLAKSNNVGIEDILANNPNIKDPNQIFIGQSINIPKKDSIEKYKSKKTIGDYAPIPAEVDYRKKTPFELDELNKKLSNEDKIKYAENGNRGTYVIEDKVNHKINVYQNGKLVEQVDSATGLNKGDRLTVTHTDKSGRLLSGQGNMSTPAGMFRISSIGEYHGVPSFQRSKINEDYNIPSSVHAGNFSKDNKNVSNGCTRVRPGDLVKLSKYIKPNTKWYILPEDENSSEFKITGNGVSFISHDPKSLFSEHARGVRKIKITPDNTIPNNKFIRTAVDTLSSRKESLISKFGVSSDTYDRLSLYALGIAGRESGYDSPGVAGSIGYLKDAVGNAIGKNMSTGPYQMRPTSVPRDISGKIFKSNRLNSADMLDPKNSTIAVMAQLSDIYKNIAPRYRSKFKDMTLDEITIAYYTNPQGVINSDEHKLRRSYVKSVLNNAKKFKIEYK
jgi:LysM repeat protein